MRTSRIGGGGTHPHPPRAQRTNVNKEKQQSAAAKKNVSATAAPPSAPKPGPNEPASSLLAANRVIDSRILRANIEAKLPAASAAAATKTSKPARRPRLDAFSQKLPTTGQPRNNPDRNRLVSPSKTSVADGVTLYPATFKRKATANVTPHLFDGEGHSRGALNKNSHLWVDFGRGKRINGEKYVFARSADLQSGKVTEGYVRRSLLNYDQGFKFSVRDGAPRPQLYDGMLNPRGELAPGVAGVKLNFGQRMEVLTVENGRVSKETYYLAFATRIKPGPLTGSLKSSIPASSWIKESDLNLTAAERSKLRQMPTVTAQAPPHAARYTPYVIQGNTSDPRNHDTDTLVTVRRGGRLEQVKFAGLKFAANRGAGVGNMEAGDYLTREGGVVNMLFSLPGGDGGVSTTVLPAGRDVIFHRWANKNPPSVDVDLYDPKTKKVALDARGDKLTMKFVYGYVDTPSGRRFGWIAYDVLSKAADPRQPSLA